MMTCALGSLIALKKLSLMAQGSRRGVDRLFLTCSSVYLSSKSGRLQSDWAAFNHKATTAYQQFHLTILHFQAHTSLRAS